jgi:LPXTG-motif cell wall-anchored protein
MDAALLAMLGIASLLVGLGLVLRARRRFA